MEDNAIDSSLELDDTILGAITDLGILGDEDLKEVSKTLWDSKNNIIKTMHEQYGY